MHFTHNDDSNNRYAYYLPGTILRGLNELILT